MKKFDQYMNDSKSCIWNSFFWKYLAISVIQLFYIRQHVSVSVLDFLAEILKANKKQCSFTQKTLLILWTSSHLTLKIICYHNAAKTFFDFTNFQFSWHPKIAFLKQISVYFCISPLENLFRRCKKIPAGGGMGGGGWGFLRKLSNFLKMTRCLGLVKYFASFHFNIKFWKSNFSTSILPSVVLKQFGLQG